MNSFVKKVKTLRSDLSDWLVHFTKGTAEEGFETLSKILSDCELRSFQQPPAICFSEAPLGELNKLFELYSNYSSPRFAPFGIAVHKAWLFDQGGRPVIYGSKSEFNALPTNLRYRHVTYDPRNYDFSWMREWRIAGDHLKLEPSETLLIVPTEDEAQELAYKVEVDYEPEGPEEVSVECHILRDWYSLTLQEVEEHEGHADDLIAKLLKKQELYKPEG
jgi:hypothetical protein